MYLEYGAKNCNTKVQQLTPDDYVPRVQFFQRLPYQFPLNVRLKMWLQLDDAPVHFSVQIRQYLNE